jgi:hypothetical protein
MDTRHEIRPDSKVARAIEMALISAGFEVVNGNQLEEIKRRKVDFSKLEGEDAKIIQRIAADQWCEVIVHGHAKADGPREKLIDLGGGERRRYYMWAANFSGAATCTDNARTIKAFKLTGPERGSEIKHVGAELAMDALADEVGERFMQGFNPCDCRGTIELTIKDVKDLGQANQIRKWLEAIGGVDVLQPRISGGLFTARLKTEIAPMDIAEKLMKIAIDTENGYRLELTEGSGMSTLAGRIVPLVSTNRAK